MKTRLTPPEHIALIPDGNRRWARTHMFQLQQGYSMGIKKFVQFALWCKSFGIKSITVWALSTENLNHRTSTELRILFGLFTKALKDESIINMLKNNQARLRTVGDLSKLPKTLRAALASVERQTRFYKDSTIYLLVNYGGRDDLVHSVKEICKDAKSNRNLKVDEEYVRDHLRTAILPDIDLVVRTSGEMRLSGLLPWQAAYSELYFAKKYWPDFKKSDLKKAIEVFSNRQRRFGK